MAKIQQISPDSSHSDYDYGMGFGRSIIWKWPNAWTSVERLETGVISLKLGI